uniref:Uncharacterized protein n=1 Tax=Lepeophtheirus salmonis TaxID=72036 RepID=A0A0K2UEI3_LEPSM
MLYVAHSVLRSRDNNAPAIEYRLYHIQ